MDQLAWHRRTENAPALFGASFVRSEAFKDLFRQGMALVEDTAAYLDGDGRTESQRLGRSGSLAYASESMRLTTRLMQIASWLLVQRAVAEGEITSGQALKERERVSLSAPTPSHETPALEKLPGRLGELIEVSLRIHARVVHLEGVMAMQGAAAPPPRPLAGENPVSLQHRVLRSAFGMTG